MKKIIELKQRDYHEIDFNKIVDIPSVSTDKKGILSIEVEITDGQ